MAQRGQNLWVKTGTASYVNLADAKQVNPDNSQASGTLSILWHDGTTSTVGFADTYAHAVKALGSVLDAVDPATYY